MNTVLAVSRRSLLKAGGLAVVFALGGTRNATAAGPMPGYVPGPAPDRKSVDSWLVIHPDNRATLICGRSEIGQGGVLGLRQIAAEELDLSLAQISGDYPRSGRDPESGETVGSSSIQIVGPMVRNAAAEARQALLGMAAQRLGATVDQFDVVDGVVFLKATPAKRVSYGELVAGKQLELQVSGKAPLKPTSAYKIVGKSVPRLDVKQKVTGAFTFAQHVRLPGMLHGRVVRPRGQTVYGSTPKIIAVDEKSIGHIPDTQVFRKRDFLAVVSKREWDAVRAAAELKVEWSIREGLPGHDGVHAAMRASRTEDSVIQKEGDVQEAFRTATHVVERAYDGPYQAHAPFAPHCAVADVKPEHATVYCSTQGVYMTRAELGKVLGLPLEKIVVQHVEGAGTFGPSCYHDVAQAAALLSQNVGKPVRVQFMRWDEFGWDNYGPGHSATVRVAVDAEGRLNAYSYDGWQQGWVATEMSEELAIGTEVQNPPAGISRVVNKVNAGSMYHIPNRLLTNHHVWAKSKFLRGSPLRSPVDLAISFASEQAIDEVARLVKMDPVEFRRRNIRNERWLGVLEAVATASDWKPAPSPKNDARGTKVLSGRGVALGTHFSSFGAAVAHVEVTPETGEVRVTRLFGALDCGQVINPRLVERQINGMLMQATSRTLHEEVQFDSSQVTSLDWGTYPVLRFHEAPQVMPLIVERRDQPATGAGEEVMAAATGAIANAVSDALGGARLQRFPLTPARVKEALNRKTS